MLLAAAEPQTTSTKTSLERIAASLEDAGLSRELSSKSLWRLIEHVAFSWLVGNGDLHTKNISAVRLIRPGALGAPPELRAVEYSPLYDLLNTTLVIRDDDFALSVNGKRNNLRPRDIANLAERWKGDRKIGQELISKLAANLRANLDDVLAQAHMPAEMSERYYSLVHARLRTFGA